MRIFKYKSLHKRAYRGVQMVEEKLKEDIKEHRLEGVVEDTPKTTENKDISVKKIVKVEYVDPITEDYKIERSNNIESKTFLVPEVWAKKDIEHNIRL